MNVRKGFVRVAVVYFGFWLLVGILGYWNFTRGLSRWGPAARIGDSEGTRYWANLQTRGGNLMEAALTFGLVIPLIAGLLGIIGWWIYRGFKPRTKTES